MEKQTKSERFTSFLKRNEGRIVVGGGAVFDLVSYLILMHLVLRMLLSLGEYSSICKFLSLLSDRRLNHIIINFLSCSFDKPISCII